MRRSSLWLRWALATASAVALGGAAESSAWARGKQNHVRDVRVVAQASEGQQTASSEVAIVAASAPLYSARLAEDGKRLIVDISNADVAGAPSALTDPAGVVGGVLTQAFRQANGDVLTRVTITLLEPAKYSFRTDGNVLRVSLRAADSSGPGEGDAVGVSSAAQTTTVRDIRFTHSTKFDTVTIEVSDDADYTVSNLPNGRSRIEIRKAKVSKDLERTLDVSAFGSGVQAVTTYRDGDRVIIEAERRADLTSQVSRRDGALVWLFAKPGQLPSSETGIGLDGGPARRTRTVAREGIFDDLPKIETDTAELVEETIAAGEVGAFTPAMAAQAEGRFTGRRIDLDLKDADIHNVLRLLADVGRLNIITADNVSGRVTIRMKNVPWDQALEVVLQTKNLGMVRQGNMIRVAPLADLEKEREMAIARRRQELELTPLETRLIPVSYAQASGVQPRARELLSPRGSLAVDERTNVLIARDVAGNLNQLEELVRALDTQTPQVLVEARIVEATSRYLRDIGIQWGGDASFSSATGNPTGLAFPSSVGLVGGAADNQAPTGGLSPTTQRVANPNFAVNLPAAVGTGSGGALGLTLGSINNTVNLGIRLSAAEASGMVRIVSSPRVLTMDNHEAKIAQGTLIPFSQISAMGVQTTFQEAKLQLVVKPHVTADGSVAMHVKVNRDEPDFNQTSARGEPTILKREAETNLLVMDGHTAVIGGIFTRNTGRNLDQVPFFGDIPLLGVLFQRRRASDSRNELVIFLTPRIVNRAEALGR